jgi:hypothetical protein
MQELTLTETDLNFLYGGAMREAEIDGTKTALIGEGSGMRPILDGKRHYWPVQIVLSDDNISTLRSAVGAEVTVVADDSQPFRLTSAPDEPLPEREVVDDMWWSEPGRMPRPFDEYRE